VTVRSVRSVRFARRDALRLLAVSLATAPAAACGILPKINEPLDLYTLTPKTTFQNPPPKVDWQLVCELPVAAAGIDSARIALQHNAYQLEYFAKAAWTDNATAMVQTLLIESFENTGSIVAVGREAIGLRPDYLLKTDLREFEAIYDGDNPVPVVWVRMIAKLVKMPERRIVATTVAESRSKAAGSKFTDVVDAFDDALGHVLKEVVVFTLKAPSQ
jgi:cholesterol transport system auxiliary component